MATGTTTRLELTQEEADLLEEILEDHLSDLRMEIADTDSLEYRERLKRKESFLKAAIGRLRGA